MKAVNDVKHEEAPAVYVPPVIQDDEAEGSVTKDDSPAEQVRQAAFQAEYQWQRWTGQDWEIYKLFPLSLDRWCWWHRMELHNAPLGREHLADPSTFSDAHVPTAWSLLFLCSHDADHILTLVPSPSLYWYAVNRWAEQHCPGEFWQAALTLMHRMEQATKATIATPRQTTSRRARPGK